MIGTICHMSDSRLRLDVRPYILITSIHNINRGSNIIRFVNVNGISGSYIKTLDWIKKFLTPVDARSTVHKDFIKMVFTKLRNE